MPIPDARRLRCTLVAGATAVVIGAGFTIVGFHRQVTTPSTRTAAEAPLVPVQPAADPDTGTDLLLDGSPTATATAPATPTTPAPTSPAATSAGRLATAPTTARKKPATTPSRRTTPPALPVRPKAPATSGAVLDRVLEHINAARTATGLAPLTLDTGLSKAAAVHNQRMIDGCGLAHQCPGEGGLGERFSAQGVRWSAAGENIGFGSAGDTDAELIRAANGLCDAMLAEVPPEDGHRRNLLNKSFERIGVSVVREPGGRIWLTQDFAA